jgi:hypothetical protein
VRSRATNMVMTVDLRLPVHASVGQRHGVDAMQRFTTRRRLDIGAD